MREKKRKHDLEKKSWDDEYIIKAEAVEVLQEMFYIRRKSIKDSLKAAADAQ